MLSSFDDDLGFDPFNYVTTSLYFNYKFVVDFDFNFYYRRIKKI